MIPGLLFLEEALKEIVVTGVQHSCFTQRAYYEDRIPDKGEVGGSSPPRPTIQINIYAAILTFPFQGTCHQKTVLPQRFAKSRVGHRSRNPGRYDARPA